MADYIDRDAVISEIERREALMVGDKRISVDAMKSFIKNRPAADVAPVVHSRWISLTECSNAGVYCSICHKKVYKEDYAWCNRKNKVRSSYCPNCGAKMDGGDSDAND